VTHCSNGISTAIHKSLELFNLIALKTLVHFLNQVHKFFWVSTSIKLWHLHLHLVLRHALFIFHITLIFTICSFWWCSPLSQFYGFHPLHHILQHCCNCFSSRHFIFFKTSFSITSTQCSSRLELYILLQHLYPLLPLEVCFTHSDNSTWHHNLARVIYISPLSL
jgi:hypothetical protein